MIRKSIEDDDCFVIGIYKNAKAYLTVESILPVMTCGSDSWHLTSATVPVWPERT